MTYQPLNSTQTRPSVGLIIDGSEDTKYTPHMSSATGVAATGPCMTEIVKNNQGAKVCEKLPRHRQIAQHEVTIDLAAQNTP